MVGSFGQRGSETAAESGPCGRDNGRADTWCLFPGRAGDQRQIFFVVVVSEWGHEWIRVVSVGLRLAPISPI